MLATMNKYSPGMIKAANTEAKELGAHKPTQAEVTSARRMLATLQHMQHKGAGEGAAVSRTVNSLTKAINAAEVNIGNTGIIPPFLNPPILLPGGPGGPVINKIRADEPLPVPSKDHSKVTNHRAGELGAAFHMMKPDSIKWEKGEVSNIRGEMFAKVAIEDHRMTDGNAVYAYIPLGPLVAPNLEKKVDPNKINTFYLQELHGGRGGEDMFAGPFTLPPGIEVAPKLSEKAELIGETVAENNGHHLSRSDSVFLRALKPLGNGKFQAKFDVSMWMDANKVEGHISCTVDKNGKLLDKGEFHSVRAHDA